MAEDWAANVKKYVPDADDGIIAGIVRYCGIALQKRDSSLVSFGDPTETGRVRENYLKKKLGLTHSDADLDAAIAKVGERMKGENFRNRVTVYYLLAEHFNLLHLFQKGGAAAAGVVAAAASAAPVAAAAAPVAAAASSAAAPVAAAAALGAAALGGVAAAASSAGDTVSAAASSTAQALTGGYGDDDDGKSGLGWLWWLLGLLALLAAAWWFFLRKPAEPVAPAGEATEAAAPASTETATVAATEAAAAPVAIPTGAGVTTEDRDGKPVVKVFFDTAKADVVPAFDPAAAGVKSYLDTHPEASLAVSGYADKRGNQAANEALSKRRAEAVKARLIAGGIAEGKIALVKPEASVEQKEDLAGARRVEVTIK